MAKRAVKRTSINVGDIVTLGAEVMWIADHLGVAMVRIQGYGYPVTLKLEGTHKESDRVTLEGTVARVVDEGARALVTVRISGAEYPVTVAGDRLAKR